ncbi:MULTISPECIES: helix-turn-helix transcriptional regulator [Streptomyces]|jgi:predicted DNA-binding transcriptional regulator YafY|uniref:helix-turn-helix transcriptional regulator n=1 Tax=unclassified Streptomyces TaxID=2593676 RepID=UPI0004C8C580|nr:MULTISPECIES: WYL domain-containing protein [unclassified Streptomyces]MDX2727671.1 WYL domain-containing protein [Streptomyces sp. PA03-2a]MDX3764153.1 WYL domain-containing protein [Streptomyces sp. AK08-01B]MDX3814164.1 WYL domain-containing protein [Streptomyces sp. AK08-01A]WSQ29943.1 WYL domain-containing protein [Streptomyces sp. NBC_01230]SCY20837.1 Predicted DNA-binding transcriptional regulator YafY, contains an HTH and WYL domains [Streptomyces sp. 136MFCol5.1]
MRAARLIKMVLLLQSRTAMTAAELARELEVSERTITRDAQALSEAGVPVYADRGRAGGYRLVGGYRTRLTGLARNEAEALFLSGLPLALREMGLEDAASAARLKVSAALLPSLRDASDTAAQRFHLDAPGWYQEPVTPELLPAVAEAVWDDRMVKARYRRGGPGSEVERELAPYGLVLKAGVWYVCARAGTDFRVYRMDRFAAVAVTDERFVRDEDFALPAFWDERAAQFARSILRTEVTVRVSEAGVGRLPHLVDRSAALDALDAAGPPDVDGWRTVVLPVESLDVAYSQLLSLGPELEVLEPAALRTRFGAAAERLSDLYR